MRDPFRIRLLTHRLHGFDADETGAWKTALELYQMTACARADLEARFEGAILKQAFQPGKRHAVIVSV